MSYINFKDALKVLGIADYEERIFNSNSHGELNHLMDYMLLAEFYSKPELAELDVATEFREWFVAVVEQAEKVAPNPEYVFQHILRIFKNCLEYEG